MAKILILEPLASGHRLQYPRRIVRELLTRGHSVLFATFPSALSNPVFRAMRREFGSNFRVIVIPEQTLWSRFLGSPKWVVQNIGFYGLFRHLYQNLITKEQVDHIYLATLEYCMILVALWGSPFGKVSFSGLIMVVELGFSEIGIIATPPRFAYLKEKLFLRLLKTKRLRQVFTIVWPAAEHIRRRYPQLAQKLIYVPDPVDPPPKNPDARKILGIRPEQKVLLVYGGLDKRKGIEELLAATGEEEFPQDVTLLVAGVQYPEVHECMSSSFAQRLRQRGRLMEINKFLDDEAERNVFSVADVVWIGYKDFYRSSGVLYLSAAMSLPVIACKEGIVGWETKIHKLGLVVDIRNAQNVVGAVKEIFADMAFAQKYGENNLKLAEKHSASIFTREICDAIEQGL